MFTERLLLMLLHFAGSFRREKRSLISIHNNVIFWENVLTGKEFECKL